MIAAALTLLPVAFLSASPQVCARRSDIVAHLAQRYQEAPTARGLAENGALLEVFAARDGASWTAVATFVDGKSCLIASGRFWEVTPQIDLAPETGS